MDKKPLLGEAFSAVREPIRDGEAGSTHPTSPSRLRTCAANARAKKLRPRRGRAVNSGQRSQRFFFGVSDLFLRGVGRLKSVEVWR